MASSYAVVTPFPGTDGTIQRMAIYKGVLYIAGNFTMVGGLPRQGFAAIDPVAGVVLPFTLSPALTASSGVQDFVILNDVIYMTGSFTTPRVRAAAYDLTGSLLPWNPILDNPGITIGTDGTQIFIGGNFANVNGATPRNHLAAFDLVNGTVNAWNPNANSGVNELLVVGNDVYVVGSFNTVNGATSRSSAAAFDKTTGVVTAWDPHFNSPALSLESFGGLIYVGGFFSQLNNGSVSRQGIAAVDPTTGAAYLPFNAGAGYSGVFRVKARNSQIFVGGFLNPTPFQNGFAILNPADGSLIPPSLNMDGAIFDAEVLGTRYFFGGSIDALSGNNVRDNLAAFVFGTNTLNRFAPSFDAAVNHLFLIDGILYAFGGFSNVTGTNGTFARNGAAAVDPNTGNVLPFDLAADAQIEAAFALGTTIYIGGQFGNIGGNPRSRVAAVDTSGAVLAWDPSTSGAANRVQAITSDGVSVYIGGTFDTVNAGTIPRNNVFKTDLLVGTADPLWDPNPDLQIIRMTNDGTYLYMSGSFTVVDGQPRSGLARVLLSGAGSVDMGWIFDLDPIGGGSSRGMSIGASNELYIAGNFTGVNGTPQSTFARITAAPALDAAWSDTIAADGTQAISVFELAPNVFLGSSTPNKHFGGQYRPLASSVDVAGNLTFFGPRVGYIDVEGYLVDVPNGVLYMFGTFKYIGIVEAENLLALDIPAPPPIGIPAAPAIEFLNRKTAAGQPTLTLFKWKPVFKDEQNNYIMVQGYRIYRTESLNLEDPVLIAEITTKDIRGFIDTMFTEEIDGFYKYCVSAFNVAGEGGKSCSAGVGLAQSDRI